MFSENPQWIFSFSTAVTLKILLQSTKSYEILWKFGKNPTTGSQDIVQTRKCDADTKADADANEIHTKINNNNNKY